MQKDEGDPLKELLDSEKVLIAPTTEERAGYYIDPNNVALLGHVRKRHDTTSGNDRGRIDHDWFDEGKRGENLRQSVRLQAITEGVIEHQPGNRVKFTVELDRIIGDSGSYRMPYGEQLVDYPGHPTTRYTVIYQKVGEHTGTDGNPAPIYVLITEYPARPEGAKRR